MAPTDTDDPAGWVGGLRGIEQRRDAERVSILGELRGEAMVFLPMTVHNISRGGAQIETSFPLLVDSIHDLRLPLGDLAVVVKGRVAHCRISDVDPETVLYRSGVEFVEPSARVLSVIADFLDALTSGRRAL